MSAEADAARSDLPIAVSCGEPAGIGPDVIVTAFAQHAVSLPPFVVFGDPDVLSARAGELGLGLAIDLAEIEDLAQAERSRLNVIPTQTSAPVLAGRLNPENGAAVIAAIDRAVDAVAKGKARAVVTAPIHKAALYEAGFSHPGHTEYLGELARRHWPGAPAEPVMMIAGPELATVPVTIHCPLEEVPNTLTSDLLHQTIAVVAQDLKTRFGLADPRIAVAGLNPHAGESGQIGHQDKDIIRPVVERFQREGLIIEGPLPADTLFHKEARETYDVAVCMYHDQALIPAKMLAFHDGVNLTLGLPFVRTSPDHGTALSLAGTGKARADSFIAALKRADQLSKMAMAV